MAVTVVGELVIGGRKLLKVLSSDASEITVFEKKIVFFGFCFATGLVFERFLAPRSRFFEKVNVGSFENSYIPENSPNFLYLPNRYSFKKPDLYLSDF
ncbi:hypothetical protein LXL04_033828 [Taraxacum kok-saghyz]